jgi:hypothetical protein
LTTRKSDCHPDRDVLAKGLCKTCYHRENARKRRQNPEVYDRVKATNRKWAQANPERERIRSRKRSADPEYRAWHREWKKQYLARNPEKRAQYRRARREKNPEKWAQDVRAYAKVRKARKRGATVSDFTAAQWEQLKIDFDYRCFYCDERPEHLQQEHLTPLSRGGDHTVSNIVPACGPCNGRKGTQTAEEFLGL